MTSRTILEVLHTQGPCSRAKLTRSTGISAPTISKAVASLIESGLIEEGELPEGTVGRPGRLVQLATHRTQVIGVVLDQHECRIFPAGLDGKIHRDQLSSFRTPESYGQLMDLIGESVEKLMARSEVDTLGIGLSIPGLVNARTEQAVLSPNVRITDGHSPARELSDRFGVEAVGLQETDALCLAQKRGGDAEFAMLDISTGLGLGVVSGGKLLSGYSGLSGELGHITIDPTGRVCGCGNRGCLETLATDTAFANLISDRLGRPVNIKEAVELIANGELQADEEIERTALYISIAIAAAINIFNPQTIFVHGRFLKIKDGLFDHIVKMTQKRALGPSFDECKIKETKASKAAGAIAGIVHHLTTELGPLANNG